MRTKRKHDRSCVVPRPTQSSTASYTNEAYQVSSKGASHPKTAGASYSTYIKASAGTTQAVDRSSAKLSEQAFTSPQHLRTQRTSSKSVKPAKSLRLDLKYPPQSCTRFPLPGHSPNGDSIWWVLSRNPHQEDTLTSWLLSTSSPSGSKQYRSRPQPPHVL